MEEVDKKERVLQRREKLVKTRRHYFKTVYRNMTSIDKDIGDLSVCIFVEGGECGCDIDSSRRHNLIQMVGRAPPGWPRLRRSC